jgi:hypothetical protein
MAATVGLTETRDTLHMWTQIIGKVRMGHAPMVNHWWQATSYVIPRGLTTSAIPHASGAFDGPPLPVARRRQPAGGRDRRPPPPAHPGHPDRRTSG